MTGSGITAANSVDSGVSGTGLTDPGIAAANSVNSGVSGTDKTGLMKTRAELTRKEKKNWSSQAHLLGPVMAGS